MLDHGDGAAGRLGRGLDRREDAEEPEGLALAGPGDDRGDRIGAAVHLLLLAGGLNGWRQASRPGGRSPIPRQRGYFAHPSRGGDTSARCASREWSVERLKGEIAVLGTPRALAPGVLRRAGAAASPRGRQRRQLLAHARPADPPADQRRTARAGRGGVYTAETVAAAGEVLVRSEYLEEDRNTFAELASRRVPVGILAQATRGRPERSVRYRELLEPSGIPHELRAAFVRRGRVWGAVHIARREASGAFTQRDADALAQVVPAIAEGIRGSLRFDAARRVGGPEAPGLVVLDAAGEVELVTPPALPLLAAIGADGTRPEDGRAALGGRSRSPPSSATQDRRRPRAATSSRCPAATAWSPCTPRKPDPGGERVAIVIEAASRPPRGDRPARGPRGDRPRARGGDPDRPRPHQRRRSPRPSSSRPTPSATTSRASSRSSASPPARSSSPASSSTSTSPR